MGFDGSGNYTRTNGTQTGTTLWQDRAAISPATISASEHDAEMNDVANALTACIKADGSKTATNNQPMGGFKHTGVANATLANEYATLGQVQTGLTVNDLIVNANSTTTALRVTQTGTGEALRVEDAANPDSTPFVVTAAGDVGIGTATPSFPLDIQTTANITLGISRYSADDSPPRIYLSKSRSATVGGNTIVQNNDGLGQIAFIGNNGTTTNIAAEIRGWVDGTPGATNDMPGRLVFSTTSDGSGTPTERMRIDNIGNVGIGTTSPTQLVTARRDSNADTFIHSYNNSNGTAARAGFLFGTDYAAATASIALASTTYTGTGGANALISANFPGPHVWTTGSSVERMRITNGGEVLIGGNVDNGVYNLQCNGTGVWGAGAYVNGSDERIKDEISPIPDCLNLVKFLTPVTYRYKEDFSKDQSIQPGFIAQHIEQVFADTDYIHGIVQDGPNYKSLAYQNLIPILTKALQELTVKVETLEAEIATLKGA